MSFTVTTNKDLKGPGVFVVEPDVFNKISDLGGFGTKASGFEGGSNLAVNAETRSFEKIQALVKGENKKKEGN